MPRKIMQYDLFILFFPIEVANVAQVDENIFTKGSGIDPIQEVVRHSL